MNSSTKHLLWLARRGRLPTKAHLVHRNIGGDQFCHVCKDKEETTEHILRSCPKVEEFGKTFGYMKMWWD